MNNDTQENFPVISEALVKELDKIFPMQDFSYTTDPRKIDYHSGQRSVINWLKDKFEIQNDNILTRR
jgi:hypothetical protein